MIFLVLHFFLFGLLFVFIAFLHLLKVVFELFKTLLSILDILLLLLNSLLSILDLRMRLVRMFWCLCYLRLCLEALLLDWLLNLQLLDRLLDVKFIVVEVLVLLRVHDDAHLLFVLPGDQVLLLDGFVVLEVLGSLGLVSWSNLFFILVILSTNIVRVYFSYRPEHLLLLAEAEILQSLDLESLAVPWLVPVMFMWPHVIVLFYGLIQVWFVVLLLLNAHFLVKVLHLSDLSRVVLRHIVLVVRTCSEHVVYYAVYFVILLFYRAQLMELTLSLLIHIDEVVPRIQLLQLTVYAVEANV